MNGLVGGLTFGIYTPHEVKVVCAASVAGIPLVETLHLAASASLDEAGRVLSEAATVAARTSGNVAIVIDNATDITPASEASR